MLLPAAFGIPWVRLALAGALLVASGYTGWAVNGWRLGGQIAQIKGDHAKQDTARANANEELSEHYRNLEKQRDDDKQEIARMAGLARVHAQSDRAVVAAGAGGLLDAFRAAWPTACAAAGAPAVAGGPPAERGVDVRAEVFAEARAAAERLAAEADQRFIAGRACEQQHDALTVSRNADDKQE